MKDLHKNSLTVPSVDKYHFTESKNLKDDDIITKPDKGKSVIILNRTDYISKTETFETFESFYYALVL